MVREKIEDLRNEFKERYGADVKIEITIYDTDNIMKPETAERIAEMVAADLGTEKSEKKYGSDKMPYLRWYKVNSNGFEFTTFFNEPQ
jgi:hypothetical protein